MSNGQTDAGTVVIRAGFPEDRPWVIENVDENVIQMATAIFAGVAADKGVEMQKQINVLLEQVEAVDALKDKIAALPTEYLVPFAQNSAGQPTLTDLTEISDLVGSKLANLSGADIDRLVAFTNAMSTNTDHVNLSDSDVYRVTTRSGEDLGLFEVTYLLPSQNDPRALEPGRLYKNLDTDQFSLRYLTSSGYVDLDSSTATISIVEKPPAYVGYDALRVTFNTDSGPKTITAVPILHSGRQLHPAASFPTTDGHYVFLDARSGSIAVRDIEGNYKTVTREEGFVIPQSEDQLINWIGQASASRLAERIRLVNETDGVSFELTDKRTVQWKSVEGGRTGYANLPPIAPASLAEMYELNPGQDPPAVENIRVGDLVKFEGKYYIKGGRHAPPNMAQPRNWFIEVTVDENKAFQLISTERDLINLRGAYGEKVLQLSQRSAEQNLFLNKMMNSYNSLLDSTTFMQKVLFDLARRLANIS